MAEINNINQIEERVKEVEEFKTQENLMLGSLSEEELVLYLENIYKNNKLESKDSGFKVVAGGGRNDC